MKACFKCKDADPTVQYRERMPRSLAVLCAACYVDARTSSTRAVLVEPREYADRYAALARKHKV